MKVVVVGSLKNVPRRRDLCERFVGRLGELIIDRNHILLTGCRGTLDKAIAESAHNRLAVLRKGDDAQLVSYCLSGAEPVFHHNHIHYSDLTDWELTHPDLKVPEHILYADAAIFIAGSQGTFIAANWARIAGLPVLGVAQFGGAGERLCHSEYKKLQDIYAMSVAREEFEVLSQYTLDADNLAQKVISLAERIVTPVPCVFIGHGRSNLWARLQVFLEKDVGLKTITYESVSHAGESIVQVLESMLHQATFAVLVLTAEDETVDGSKRPRQNVVHEVGLFQGQLGFSRAILLQQRGIEDFSNLAGLQYIAFDGEKIESTFGELKRVLKREGLAH